MKGLICSRERPEKSTASRLKSVSLWAVVAAHGICVVGCAVADEEPALEAPLFPIVEAADAGGAISFEFGPGNLTTTDNTRWGGTDLITFPPILDPVAGPVTVEIKGLNLSAIRYTGDMGWPPDSTDTGALVDLGLAGSTVLAFRIHSNLAGERTLWTGSKLDPTAFAQHRAYAMYLVLAGRGGLGSGHGSNVEVWDGPSSGKYDVFDLRLRYAGGFVSSWARLHTSRSWDTGDSATGRNCPWNVAINTAVEGTADSIWDGQCLPGRDGQTGRARGAWVASSGTVRLPDELGAVQPQISLSNWAHARGPYRVSWDNLVVTGVLSRNVPTVFGVGRFIPMGTAEISALIPMGHEARFSFVAVGRGAGRPGGAQFRYRTSGIDLIGASSNWVLLDSSSVSFAGSAFVNGAGGYQYEMQGSDGRTSDAGARLSVRIWTTAHGIHRPTYVGFGSVTKGRIRVWVP